MSIGLSLTNKLFHGTNRQRFDSIVINGFQLGIPHPDRFIGSSAIYFVANRPLIARRFALMAASEEQCKAVVISVELKSQQINDELLDLTTDKGLHILYKGHLKLERLFKQNKRRTAPKTPTVYEVSLEMHLRSFELYGEKLLKRMSERKKPLNWDSPALDSIAIENNCAVIVAAIQEGTTFNTSFTHEQYTHGSSKNYHGMGYRDHIEVSVLDSELIDMNTLKVRPEEEDIHNYEAGFVNAILDFRTPDAV